MKYYKQILEAINKGVLLALDDFEGEEPIKNIKSKLILNRDYTKEYLDLMKDVVDLGLPSGTLWCKYNLDVNPNQLAKAEDWYGKYYAWGELEGNKTNEDGEIYFNWDNYKFGKDYNKLTKYCNNYKYGYCRMDNLIKLLPEDDAAYIKQKCHNFKFHIPTKELFEELINYTKNYWVKNYNPNKTIHNPKNDGGILGLNGSVFEGLNENQLFIPAAGVRCSSVIYDVGSDCNLWSSSLYLLAHPSDAYYLYFDSDHIGVHSVNRYFGFTIHPVINL